MIFVFSFSVCFVSCVNGDKCKRHSREICLPRGGKQKPALQCHWANGPPLSSSSWLSSWDDDDKKEDMNYKMMVTIIIFVIILLHLPFHHHHLMSSTMMMIWVKAQYDGNAGFFSLLRASRFPCCAFCICLYWHSWWHRYQMKTQKSWRTEMGWTWWHGNGGFCFPPQGTRMVWATSLSSTCTGM